MITLLIFLNAFFVSFADKPQTGTPALSERALQQREKWNIAIDELDYPVNAEYVDSLRRMGVKIYHTSRWMNGATVEMSSSLATQVEALEFVTAVEMTRDNSAPIYGARKRKMPSWTISENDYMYTDDQLKLYNLLKLHEYGIKGEGIVMTICDGGFYNAQNLSCFRQSELELGHFDFTDDTDDFYGYTGAHGTECLSVVSGIKSNYQGAATQAKYSLMRSEEVENNRESPKEMDNFVAALEKSDSLGVNIFSVSLGYAYFDNDSWTLPKSALDGKTTRASRAATIAARKGMLVCVAAGNEGDDEWHTISVPADADSILAVGAVGTDSIIGDFSSYGPSADWRVKPEVCAVGVQAKVINPNDYIMSANGTSFATPLLAGLAAALWSALPDENAMQIRERIIRSADRYNKPDKYQYGYGIPDAWKALHMNTGEETITTITQPKDEAKKIIRGDQILIVRYGHIYNLAGQMIE